MGCWVQKVCERTVWQRAGERACCYWRPTHSSALPSAEPQCSIMTYSPDASLPPRFILFFIFLIVSVLVQTETAVNLRRAPGARESCQIQSRCAESLPPFTGARWGRWRGKGGGREGSCWLLSSNRSQVRRCRCRRTDGARRCWMFPLDGMRWRRAEGGRVFMSSSCLRVSSPATYELQRSRNLPRSAAWGGVMRAQSSHISILHTRRQLIFLWWWFSYAKGKCQAWIILLSAALTYNRFWWYL